MGAHGFSGNTCPLDNCPATANPDQLDTNQDGSGDACQPVLALLSIQQDGGSALELRTLARDPQGEPLSGLIQIDETVPTPIVLLTYPFTTWPPRGDSIASLTRGAVY